jgi:HEAT repeat protein
LVLAALLAAGTPGRAATEQLSLASRIDAVKSGRVRVTFAARDGVCGNGMSWFRTKGGSEMSGTVINGNWSGSRDVVATCERGPVRVVFVRDTGATVEIRTYVGGTWKADTGITDLGAIGAREAALYLLRVAESGPDKPARAAISAATLADSIDAGSTLLRIAKDEKRPADVRSAALNWLADVVGDKVSALLDSLAYEPGDREVRKQAIFAMSRRPVEEAVPALLKMAESLPDRELRKTAVFWLARIKDPRAIQWIETRMGR